MKTLHFVLVLVAALAVSGCIVETQHPIATPAISDDAVVGSWINVGDPVMGSAVSGLTILSIQSSTEDKTRYDALWIAVEPGKGKTTVSRFTVRLTEIGGRRYFEAEPVGKAPALQKVMAKRLIGRYAIGAGLAVADAADAAKHSKDYLSVAFPSGDEVREAIKNGTLNGRTRDKEWVQVDEPADKLRAWLASRDIKLFGLAFERLKGSHERTRRP
jgi:hypothetical protein